MSDMDFETWMKQVNLKIGEIAFVDVLDLPDCDYHWWWEDEYTPTEAARKALKNAGYPHRR